MKINFFDNSSYKLTENLKLKIIQKYIQIRKKVKKQDFDEVNIVFVKPEVIKALNYKHLKRNYPTDVMSFKPVIPVQNTKILGDIVICPQVAKENAQKYNHPLEKEIETLAIHGFLHLLGFNHENKADREKWKNFTKKLRI